MDYLEKEMPSAPDAERAILGALIISPDMAPDTIPKLRAEDFYNSNHRFIFSAIRETLEAGKDIDPVLLAEHLREQGATSVSLAEIINLTCGVPHQLRLDSYIKRIQEKAQLRNYIKKADELVASINDGEKTLEEIAQLASTSFDGLAEQISTTNTPLIKPYADFMKQQFIDGDVIAFHTARGELALVQSVTNHGKSTLIRNSALTLAAGGEFLPVIRNGAPRKVLLLNFEGAGARFQRDLEVMTRDLPNAEMELIRANLFPVHAPVINDESITLSHHMPLLEAQARRIKPDVIIIDTASVAFDIRNENDNAEIQGIMKRLIRLARRLNCLVILLHHIGKAKLEAGQAREAAHRGRGASAWSDLATTIFNLEADARDPDQAILGCAKRKDGENYECILKLNRDARWFSISEETREQPLTSYELVIEALKGFTRDVTRGEIETALLGKVPKSTITRHLRDAINKGDIIKPRYGLYRFKENAQQPNLL